MDGNMGDEAKSISGERDFGEVLRHELNNLLTGIVGNAELLLVEVRRKSVELPQPAQARWEIIASLAVRCEKQCGA